MEVDAVPEPAALTKEYQQELVSVKPWLEISKMLKREKLHSLHLYALFKCMHEDCVYSTSYSTQMNDHLEFHDNMSKLSPFIFSDTSQVDWLLCCYCQFGASKPSSLIEHIKVEHESSPFQCPFCYYRTIEVSYVFQHLEKYHPQESKEIWCSKNVLNPLPSSSINIPRIRSKFIPAYKCDGSKFTCTYCFLRITRVNHILIHRLQQ